MTHGGESSVVYLPNLPTLEADNEAEEKTKIIKIKMQDLSKQRVTGSIIDQDFISNNDDVENNAILGRYARLH